MATIVTKRTQRGLSIAVSWCFLTPNNSQGQSYHGNSVTRILAAGATRTEVPGKSRDILQLLGVYSETSFINLKLGFVSKSCSSHPRATNPCEASVLANRITEVEMENQEQQRILEESLAAGAELKEKCMVEQQELSRLKQIWSDTQPELLLGMHCDFGFDMV